MMGSEEKDRKTTRGERHQNISVTAAGWRTPLRRGHRRGGEVCGVPREGKLELLWGVGETVCVSEGVSGEKNEGKVSCE